MSPGVTISAAALCSAVVLLACSQEKKSDNPGEPTPFDMYVARERLKHGNRQSGVDSSRKAETAAAMRLTGDPDHDFLRAMSNHHKHVIVLADAALESNRRPEMVNVIRKVEERHGHELDDIAAILRKAFKDTLIPEPNDETRANADAIRRSADNRSVFLASVAKAESEALVVEKSFLSKGSRPDVKRLAARIKAGETSTISDLRKRIAQ